VALPTAAQVRAYIPSLTGTTEDVLLGTMIATADAQLAAWLNFPPATDGGKPSLESATYTIYLDGPTVPSRPTEIRLPCRPVASITSLHDDRNRDWAYDASDLVDSGDYVLKKSEGVVRLKGNSSHGTFTAGDDAIKVVFVGGFDTGATEAITKAIGLQVAHEWNLKASRGRSAVSIAGASETRLPELISDEVKELLSTYKLWELEVG